MILYNETIENNVERKRDWKPECWKPIGFEISVWRGEYYETLKQRGKKFNFPSKIIKADKRRRKGERRFSKAIFFKAKMQSGKCNLNNIMRQSLGRASVCIADWIQTKWNSQTAVLNISISSIQGKEAMILAVCVITEATLLYRKSWSTFNLNSIMSP